jgi:hypothetical protein
VGDGCHPVLTRPGGDRLSRALRRSTIGAEGFHGRVRDGIGCFTPRYSHQAMEGPGDPEGQKPEGAGFWFLSSGF